MNHLIERSCPYNLELKTVQTMIKLYCTKRHGCRTGLCEECAALAAYAEDRLIKCPFGAGKPVCAKCSVHCYRTDMRENIRWVMRFAGPRMLVHSPLLTLRYLYRKFTK